METIAPLSEFARVLLKIIDEAHLFKRREWASILSVSGAAISQWVNDRTFPRPEVLRLLVSVVRRHSNRISPATLSSFEVMMSKSALEVSPAFHQTIGDSVASYTLQPLLKQFLRDLKRIAPRKQEDLILKFSEECARVLYPPELSGKDKLAPTAEPQQRHGYELRGQQNPPPEWLQAHLLRARARFADDDLIKTKLINELLNLLPGSSASLRSDIEQFCIYALALSDIQQRKSPASLLHGMLRIFDIPLALRDFSFARQALLLLFRSIPGAAIVSDLTLDGDRNVAAPGSRGVMLGEQQLALHVNTTFRPLTSHSEYSVTDHISR